DVILESSKIMQNYDIEGAIVTNGTLFTENMVKKLVKRRWEGIAFSINGAKAQTDDFLRGREGTFKKSIKNIRLFNKWKKQKETEYPKLTIQMVITKYNYDEILPMYEMAKEENIDIILYRMVNEGGDDEKRFYIEEGALREVKEQLQRVKSLSKKDMIEVKQEFEIEDVEKVLRNNLGNKEGEEAKKSFEKDEEEKNIPQIPCAKPFSEMVILADGTAHPCCVIAESKYKDDGLDLSEIEDIKNKNLEDVWNSRKMDRIRKTMMEDELPERCKRYCTLDMIYREKSGAIYENKW
ncbi:MAG: SPASM domain-containing protein, partial [Candidatus Aenigmatarchaeota archaeon]